MFCFRRAIPTEMNCTSQFNHDGKKDDNYRRGARSKRRKKREECSRPKPKYTNDQHKLASHAQESRVIDAKRGKLVQPVPSAGNSCNRCQARETCATGAKCRKLVQSLLSAGNSYIRCQV